MEIETTERIDNLDMAADLIEKAIGLLHYASKADEMHFINLLREVQGNAGTGEGIRGLSAILFANHAPTA